MIWMNIILDVVQKTENNRMSVKKRYIYPIAIAVAIMALILLTIPFNEVQAMIPGGYNILNH